MPNEVLNKVEALIVYHEQRNKNITLTSTIHLHSCSWPPPAPRHQMQTCRSSRSPRSAGKSITFAKTPMKDSIWRHLGKLLANFWHLVSADWKVKVHAITVHKPVFPPQWLICFRMELWCVTKIWTNWKKSAGKKNTMRNHCELILGILTRLKKKSIKKHYKTIFRIRISWMLK